MAQPSNNTQSQAMATPQTSFQLQPQSRLLSLAGELLNRIYRAAVINESPITITLDHRDNPEGKPCFSLEPSPPLLLACKQTRHEAWAIYWTENVFKFDKQMLKPGLPSLLGSIVGSCLPKIAIAFEYQFELYVNHSQRTILPRTAIGLGLAPQCSPGFYRVMGSIEVKAEGSTVLQVTAEMDGPKAEAEGGNSDTNICLCEIERVAVNRRNVVAALESISLIIMGAADVTKVRPLHCWTCGKKPVL
jgi:hypothetical protein